MATPKNASVQKAFQILEAFAPAGCQLTATEVASRTAMTVATAHRFLLTLEHLGVVSRAGGNRFQLGTLLAELGGRVEHDKLMARIARSHVDDLATRLGGAVAAAVLSGRKAIQMAMSPDPAASAGEPPDPRLPVHCTAAGKVLLAGLRPAMLEAILDDLELTAYTPRTVTDGEKLRAELETVRARGWALEDAEFAADTRGIAVPILDGNERVVAALAMTGSRHGMDDGDMERYREELARHAARIHRELYMENKVLPTKARPRGNFPHAKRIGDLILVSGTSARQPDDTFPGVVPGTSGAPVFDFRIQARIALTNLFDIVASFGAAREDIVEIQAFLVGMKHYDAFNEVYGEFYDQSGPTRTTVGVSELPHPHQLLMLKAMAYKPVAGP